jgi:1-acyl-sn-glycerol-3-phosphate acyltransferase
VVRPLRTLILYAFHLLIARPLLLGVVGVRYRRRDRLPAEPCLVVSNHNSHLDAAVLMTMFPLRRLPRVHPVAAADYFGRSWFMAMWAMLFMNGVPIERKPRGGQDPLQPVVDRLLAGDSLIFFPEGSRGEPGVVARFRPGVGALVRSVPGLLVVPVYLSGPERIWPRGNFVPVPLSIDAHIGRPRTYSATDDPKDIADRVREDVLALAPAPPPLPGARPSPPLRVALCGADAQARRELFARVTERLGRVGRTVGVGDPVIEADGRGAREFPGPVAAGRGRPWLRLLAAVFRTGERFEGERFVEMLERSWLSEALEHGSDTRFVTADGSPLVDLMAWAVADLEGDAFDESGLHHMTEYLAGRKKIPVASWWRFLRRAPAVWLINVLNLARPPVPDVLVHLRVPGDRLDRAYEQVGGVLRRRQRVELIELRAAAPVDEAADRVEQACRRLSDAARAAAAAP